MKISMIVNSLWPILLVLFLGISVGQLAERLKSKTVERFSNMSHESVPLHNSSMRSTRVNAMLGGACMLVVVFWSFDALLSWWLYAP